MDGIGRDLVHAWRGLRRAPGFALVVILTLGMAIGANATMFGLADRLLFRAPAGIGHPEQVRRVLVARWIKGLGRAGPSMSYPAFMDFRDRTRSFQHVAAVEEVIYSYGSGASARPAYVTLATGQYFQLLEVQPLLGRLFGEPDDPPGAGRQVAVLSHPFWRSAFGGDRNVVGRTVELGKRQFTVIGVAPEGFTGTELSRVDMWIPMSASSGGPFGDEGWLQSRGSQWLQTIVRLKPGVEDGSATQDATRAYREGHADEKPRDFHQKAEASFAGLTGASLAGTDGSTARVAAWLLGVTVMLLVIACANVANLVLARGLLRRGEIAVRLAMGVSRGRLLRQLLTESFLLAGLGLGLGLVLVRGASGLLRSLLLPGYAWEGNPVDQRVLAVTIVATLLAAITAGLLPLWRGTRTDVAAQLHGANRSTAAHSKKLRTGLLLVQTGLSTALLIGAGLFLKSLTAVRGLDLGFTPGQLAVVTVDLQPQGIRGPEIKAFYEAAVERVRRIPGIQAAGLSIGSPFMGNWAEQVRLPGADSVLPELAGGGPYFFRVGAGGLEALGVRLLRGRLFTEADDRADAAPVVIVSDRMARTLWQGRDAIGQCLMRGGETVKCHTVVGVVADLHRQALEERERPFFLYFIPLKQDTEYGVPQLLLARVTGDPERWTEAIRKELLVVRPDIPYVSIRSYQNIVDGRARSWRLGASMLTVFGVLSLIIAGIGLYGVLSFAVTQRTQELGIRAALGASPGRLMKLILSSGVTTAVVGVVLGTALALALSSRITPLLFHTSAKDVVVYGATGATILLVAVLASWVPGRRATRVEPVRALKAE